ncbi:hypothetical protein DFH28DRAFT_1117046 [Melampsora americana]|nr:hypothetical protein DFH28DRAFT_1117046 [Melampsora americana]
MDSTNSSNPSPSLPPQHIPTSTPTPISNSVQSPSVSININAAESQRGSTLTPFVIPTLSSADWARTQQVVTSDPSNSISQPASNLVMATNDAPQKKRGRPRKAPTTASQKPSRKQKALDLSQPTDLNTQIEPTLESQADTQTELDDDNEKIKGKKCWFTPESDGKSDIDLVAEWCSDFDNFNAWRTQLKNIVSERVSEYLVSKGHANRGGQECAKKINMLVEWFHQANSLRQATGEGNQNVEVEFKVSKEELAELKWNKRRVKKGEEEGGSLQVRILRRCPWYEELEPVLRDRPTASPLAYRDSLGDQLRRSSLSSANEKRSQSPTETTQPETSEDTPPCHQVEDNLPNSQDLATPIMAQGPHSNKPSRPVTPSPCNMPSKRPQSNPKDISSGTKESPQNSGDIFSALNRLPTKQDMEASKIRALKTQENMSSNFSKELSRMMTTNRATEMATKENIAISKMNVNI